MKFYIKALEEWVTIPKGYVRIKSGKIKQGDKTYCLAWPQNIFRPVTVQIGEIAKEFYCAIRKKV